MKPIKLMLINPSLVLNVNAVETLEYLPSQNDEVTIALFSGAKYTIAKH